jgi:hypothetical protein
MHYPQTCHRNTFDINMADTCVMFIICSKSVLILIIIIVIRLSGVGSRGEQLKQGAPDFPFPGHIDQL